MSLSARMVAAGLSAIQCQAIQGSVATGLTATGTNQGTAIPIGADVNNFTTVASGTGTLLPPMNPGDSLVIRNSGANALLVYPPVGGIINNLAANTGYSLATTTPLCELYCIGPLLYVCSQGA